MIKAVLSSLRKLSLVTSSRYSKRNPLPTDNPEVADFSNILLADVNHAHLMREISGSLGLQYLSPYKNASTTA